MLISEPYRVQQAELHKGGKYGITGAVYAGFVSQLVENVEAQTLLDYGCGSRRSLMAELDCTVKYAGYDPGVPEFSADPLPADVVACIDVLEHVEPECLESVLDHLGSLAKKRLFVSVHVGPADKTLPDGRNAHLIQEGSAWWLSRLLPRWNLLQFAVTRRGFWAVMNGY